MPFSPSAPAPDPGGRVTLRPRSALVICVLAAVVALALSAEAVIATGWAGVALLPLPLFLLAGVWALLWAPCLVIDDDHVEVRNILRIHRVPFAAIERVRLGSMLRLDVRGVEGEERTITAWNAPGLPRDTPWRRRDTGHGEAPRGARERRRERPSAEQRLLRDQQASPSALLGRRMDAWENRAGTSTGTDAAPPSTTRPHVEVLAVLGAATALLAVRLLV